MYLRFYLLGAGPLCLQPVNRPDLGPEVAVNEKTELITQGDYEDRMEVETAF